MALAAALVACGGGGGASGGSAGQQTAANTYVAAMPTAGDYFTWENVTREQGSTVDYYSYTTQVVRTVAGDGANSTDTLNDYINATSPLAYTSNTYTSNNDKLGQWLGSTGGSCMAAPNPPTYLVAPNAVSAGMNWQSSGIIQSKCGLGAAMQRSFVFKDNIFPMERVTVPAGAFNAFKIVRNANEEDSNQRQVGERTCWWEPDLGIDVKCVSNFTVTDKTTGASRVSVETDSLLGYSKQKLGRRTDTLYRFLGNWTGRFDGMVAGQNVSGSCSLMFDGPNISGTCTGAAVAFDVAGTVWADGSLSFTAGNNGLANVAFKGKFDNLQQMSGNWSVPNYGSGSWVLTQD